MAMDAFSSTDQLQELDHENPVKQQKKNSMIARRYSLSPKARAYKNILGGGFSFMLIISSVLALLGLQSSLNDEEGLGLATLAIASTTFLISGVFTSSFIRALGTKYASLAAYAMSFVYLISNFYPSWYTLVPGAICYGLALGPIFASVNIHATVTAIRYASDLREDVNDLIAFFNGIVTMFYKVAFLPGNLATTIILFSERANSGNSIIQSQASLGSVCNGTDAQDLDEKYIYVLLSCFVVVVTIAIALAFIFVDNPPRTKLHFQSCGRTMKIYVKDPIAATLKMLLNWSIILLLPNVILNAFLTSSTLGILAKVSNYELQE